VTYVPRGCPEHVGVIGDPLPESPRRRSDDVGHYGRHVRRVSDRRTPRVEEHLYDRRRPVTRRLSTELIWRQLLEADPTAEDIPDHAHLLRLAQRLGACEDVVAARMPLLIQGARRHGRDVTLVDRCRLGPAIRPSDDVAVTDGGTPPELCVRREHPRPDERRFESGGHDQVFDLGIEASHGVRLLEQRVGCLVRRGEEDDAPRVQRETLDHGRSGIRRRGPEKENCTDALQRCVERVWHGEVARNDIDGLRQAPRRRLTRERSHRHACSQQLGDDRASDPAGGPRHQDGLHMCAYHDGLRGVRFQTAELKGG
jgi:hypothetical protein